MIAVRFGMDIHTVSAMFSCDLGTSKFLFSLTVSTTCYFGIQLQDYIEARVSETMDGWVNGWMDGWIQCCKIIPQYNHII